MSNLVIDKVIAHFRDGTLVKGTTNDFDSNQARFVLSAEDGRTHRVALCDLKALFFVRELGGNASYSERKGFFTASDLTHRVLVEFLDDEVIFGYCRGYSSRSQGFFLVPGDPDSNNILVFVVRTSIRKVKVKAIGEPQEEPKGEEPPTRTPADA